MAAIDRAKIWFCVYLLRKSRQFDLVGKAIVYRMAAPAPTLPLPYKILFCQKTPFYQGFSSSKERHKQLSLDVLSRQCRARK